jgi:NAD kinase
VAKAKLPRVVVVTRATDYEALLVRHATREQARFFLETRGQDLEAVEATHRRFHEALAIVLSTIPAKWRRARVDRADLSRFLFEPDDVVVALGQDGLVANLAKYLDGQPVVGLNPDPARYEGILVPHPPEQTGVLIHAAAEDEIASEGRTMVEARLDDGQRLLALNEVFAGHLSHQSARYRIRWRRRTERHSSSGVIVTTGTGATGWARSIARQRREPPPLPGPTDPALAFFVREPFPSVATEAGLDAGVVRAGESLEIVSEMNEGGVLFGDGIEADRLAFGWGVRARISVSEVRLRLVR